VINSNWHSVSHLFQVTAD